MKNEKSLKILMLEDSRDDINMIERVLRKSNISFIAQHVDAREEFTNAIRSFKPDVVLSDHGLPQFNSKEALKICLAERSSIPFIVVTGTMSDEFAITCLQDGADDYVLKANLSRLPLAIIRAIKERRLEKLKREAKQALRRQNAELLKVNRELDNFVYSVSHNLRGPLASVLGLLTVAKMEDTEKKLAPIFSMMNISIQKLDETLKEIIDYSRNSRSDLQIEVINWPLLIEKSLSKLEHLANYNLIKFEWNLQTDIAFTSDPHRLRSVLINLLSNAISYIGSGPEPIITVDIITLENEAYIRIKDNGIGIKTENLTNIFNMFYRGTELSKGAGLGLYIAQEIVKKLRGNISINSMEGKGTIATVTIPAMGENHSIQR